MKKCCIKMLFMLVIMLTLLLITNGNVFAASEGNIEIETAGDYEADDFIDSVIEELSLEWIVYEPTISYATEEYALANNDLILRYPEYYPSSLSYALNQEIYGLYGIDSVGENRLIPTNDLVAAPSVYSEGAVNLSIRKISFLPAGCSIANDTRKLKDVDTPIYANSDQKIGTGIVLYRHQPLSTTVWTTNWNYISLNMLLDTDIRINFPVGQRCQVVVIYEIKEEAPNIFKPHIYHHIRAVYYFNTR